MARATRGYALPILRADPESCLLRRNNNHAMRAPKDRLWNRMIRSGHHLFNAARSSIQSLIQLSFILYLCGWNDSSRRQRQATKPLLLTSSSDHLLSRSMLRMNYDLDTKHAW